MEKVINKKQKKWPLKEMVITFLAISKIGAWLDKVIQFAENDYYNVWELIFDRIITRDIWIVLSIVVYYSIDKYKIHDFFKSIILYLIMLVGLKLFYFAYSGGIGFDLNWFLNFTVVYLIIAIALFIKEYLKEKGSDRD